MKLRSGFVYGQDRPTNVILLVTLGAGKEYGTINLYRLYHVNGKYLGRYDIICDRMFIDENKSIPDLTPAELAEINNSDHDDDDSIDSNEDFECEFCHLMLEGWEKDYHFDGHWCDGCNKPRPCFSYKCECGHVEEEE